MTVIHHLDCGTMCPRAAHRLHLVEEPGATMVAHCLLLETADGLVLLDTGFGTGDLARPRRLGASRFIINPLLRRRAPRSPRSARSAWTRRTCATSW